MPRNNVHRRELRLNKKLITSLDPSLIGENYRELTNVRYTSDNLEGVRGMAKINSTAFTTYTDTRNAIQFDKDQPLENHLLTHSYNTDHSASKVRQFTQAVPETGDRVETDLWSDSSGAGTGYFSIAPKGHVCYCNGVDTCIWGGDESEVGAFLNYDAKSSGFEYDQTEKVQNTLATASQVCTVVPDEDGIGSFYLGATRPLSGFTFYIGTANTATSTMTAYYWNGTDWAAVSSLSDGTADGGISCAQTGTVTFTSTVSTAKLKMYNGAVLYYYKIQVSEIDATVTISHVTVQAPFQLLNDVWSGEYAECMSFIKHTSKKDTDYTQQVREEDFYSLDKQTYANVSELPIVTGWILVGFTLPQQGVWLGVTPEHVNTNTATATVEYWNGSAWTTVTNIIDETFDDGSSLGKAGSITWLPVPYGSEYKKKENKDVALYYYKISFSGELDNGCYIDYCAGIPAPYEIRGYQFPLYAKGRLMLCNNVDHMKNSVLVSSVRTPDCFNGPDSTELIIGDDTAITGGLELFAQFGGNFYSMTIFFKRSEMWALTGNNPEEWTTGLYRVSNTIGCPAPKTLTLINLPGEGQNLNRNLAIWQGNDGIYLSDGRAPVAVHWDISNYFDKKKDESLTAALAGESVGFYDAEAMEWHWLFASGSTATKLNKELVLNMRSMRWFEIDRGTGNDLQYGMSAKDGYGNSYTFGFLDTGYMERLEYGTTFDGTAISHTLFFGDMALYGDSVYSETKLRNLGLIVVAKTTTTNSVTCTHYGDGSSTGTSFTLSPSRTGYRIARPDKSHALGDYIFHGLKFTMETDDETTGFEPLYLILEYNVIRESI